MSQRKSTLFVFSSQSKHTILGQSLVTKKEKKEAGKKKGKNEEKDEWQEEKTNEERRGKSHSTEILNKWIIDLRSWCNEYHILDNRNRLHGCVDCP